MEIELIDGLFFEIQASTIRLCSRNDPDLARCIIKSVSNLQPRLATGRIADDFVVPALEPLFIDTYYLKHSLRSYHIIINIYLF